MAEKHGRARKPEGFTLIEILLVVVIIGILAALVVPRLAGTSTQARIAAAKHTMSTLQGALSRFEIDCGKFPTTEQGLEALIMVPSPAPKGWKGPYLNAKPKDPWGNEYIYRFPGSSNPAYFDLISMGPDGQEGTPDDIDLFKLSSEDQSGGPPK